MTETEGLALAGGLVGGVLAVVIIAAIAFYILLIIALWKIFVKAGEAGWKSIIPIYNAYILCKILKLNFWVIILLIPFCLGLVSGIVFKDNQDISSIATSLYTCVLDIIMSIRLSKAFGKGTGFTLGLIFFPNIFTLILGFGNSKYVGIKD